MHMTVLVFVDVLNKNEIPKSYPELVEDAIEDAKLNLDTYVGTNFDYYDIDDELCKTFLTTKSGEKCQACRVTNFKEFTDGLPGDLICGNYIDSFMFEKYGVDWSTVVERELKEATEHDTPGFQKWIVAVDVHI